MKKPLLFVLGQFVLLAFVAFGARWRSEWGMAYVGMMGMGIGFLVLVVGFGFLGRSLTPNPVPKETAKLVTNGIYAVVRHPIYVGLILMCAGWSTWQASWVSWLSTILLCFLLNRKARFEEQLLHHRYGSEYNAYCKRVGRFFPRLF